jgi:hypothetical protein
MTIELDSTLAQAEVLFLSFSQIVADIDRRKIEQESSRLTPAGNSNLRNRASKKKSGKSVAPNFSAVQISDELRVLLSVNNYQTPEA